MQRLYDITVGQQGPHLAANGLFIGRVKHLDEKREQVVCLMGVIATNRRGGVGISLKEVLGYWDGVPALHFPAIICQTF